MRIIDRQAMRAILLTPDDRVLLMRVDYGAGDWWITPGGGTEPGETPEATLRRELMEELGFALPAPGPLVWRRRVTMTLGQHHWRQSEDYFLVETAAFRPAVQAAPEAGRIREFRWWRLAELRHSAERIAPAALARIVLDYRANGPPAGPLPIEIVGE
ncbi:NUDIX hydrolase [Paracoccus binzhouensis]|uniref:NUDIX hydrolase n=1 Tax=Paracoccus binzhouensis TaxID=2796149 RepID=UPI0018EED4C7|nr:NUDIX domain-containing protein [Paracoccus binzhouensis]